MTEAAQLGSPSRAYLGGLPLDEVTHTEALRRIERWVEEGGYRYVVTVSAWQLANAEADPEYLEAAQGADLSTVDGVSALFVARLKGAHIPERVTGSGLTPQLLAIAAERGWPVFAVGSTEETLRSAREHLEARFKGLRFESFSPNFTEAMTPEWLESTFERVRAHAPKIVFVCLGSPKMEKWMLHAKGKVGSGVALGFGGVLDEYSEERRPVPRWMKRVGLEWSARLFHDPRWRIHQTRRGLAALARCLAARPDGASRSESSP